MRSLALFRVVLFREWRTSNNVIIAQEIIKQMHKTEEKKGYMVMKIDLEKPYNNVDWNFLQETLVDFGFLDRIVSLIMLCVSSSSLSLIWNGNRMQNFVPTRGLR